LIGWCGIGGFEFQQLLVDNYAHRSFHAEVKEKPGHCRR
jgi:hypothetical protein